MNKRKYGDNKTHKVVSKNPNPYETSIIRRDRPFLSVTQATKLGHTAFLSQCFNRTLRLISLSILISANIVP